MKSILAAVLMLSASGLAQQTKVDPNLQIGGPLTSANAMLPGVKADGANGIGVAGDVSTIGMNVCSDTSGSGTAQVCSTASTFTPVALSCITYSTTTTNGGTGLTVNVNSFGAKSIAIPGASGWTTTLTAGIVPANKPIYLCYDGTNWDAATTGVSATGGGNVASVANSDSTLTISPTAGSVVASLNLGHANTWTATQTFPNATITNAELANPSVTIGTTSVSLGATVTTIAGLTLTAPNLGTPTSLTLTSATGLPLSTGVTGTLQAAQEPAHTGDMTNTAGSLATTVKGLNGTLLSSLGSGLLFNTTSTGVPSIATPAQIVSAIGSTAVTNATNVGTTASSTNATFYIPFVASTSGNQALDLMSGFTFNPSTGNFSVPGSLISTGPGGVLTLNGTTSGTATLTAPAVAATVTNPFLLSNSITVNSTTSGTGYGLGDLAPSILGIGYGNTAEQMFLYDGDYVGAAFSLNGSDEALEAVWNGVSSSARIFGFQGSGYTVATSMSQGAAGLLDIGQSTTSGDHTGFIQTALTKEITGADWTCGTGGTVTSCTSATTIGTLTWTLPLLSLTWHFDCNLIVSQATAATANEWLVQTATNGATNIQAEADVRYSTATNPLITTGQASTTTAVEIGGATWTPAATATKYLWHISGTVEGASASGTVLNLQLLAPTVADLVTVYRGSACVVGP